MSLALFISVFFILTIFYTIVGIMASRNVSTTSDYFLAGRNLGLMSITFTLIATQLGGGMLLGTSQEAYTIGLYGLLYTLGMSIGFLILGLGFAGRLQAMNVSTTAEIFETKYKSVNLKKIASILSIITLWGLLIGQVVASKSILIGLGFPSDIPFLLFWAFVIGYTMIGGLHAVVMTDLFQVLFIILIFGGIFLYLLFSDPQSFINTLKNKDLFISQPLSIATIISTFSMPILFSLIEQDLAQRFFAARTKRIAALSAIGASFFLIVFALIPVYFGMQAKVSELVVPAGGSPLIPFIESFTSEFILVLALCGIIAAVTSTADSLLCAISSNLAQDFDFSWTGIKNKLHVSQIVTLLVGLGALIGSYFVPQNIIGILIGSYELSVSCLLVPLVVAYFKKEVKKGAALYSMACGLFGFFAIIFWKTPFPSVIFPLSFSTLGYIIGHYTEKN